MKKIIRLINGMGTINEALDTFFDGENVKTLKEWELNDANEIAALAELAKYENTYKKMSHNSRSWIEADEYALMYAELDDDGDELLESVAYTPAKNAQADLFVVKNKNGEIIEEEENYMNLLLDDAEDADEVLDWCRSAKAGDVFKAEIFSLEVVNN